MKACFIVQNERFSRSLLIGSNDIFNFWVKFSYWEIIFHINIATYWLSYQTCPWYNKNVTISQNKWPSLGWTITYQHIYRKPLIFICQPLKKKQVDTLETSHQEKVKKPPLTEIDSDDDNESEVNFEKDIESDKGME